MHSVMSAIQIRAVQQRCALYILIHPDGGESRQQKSMMQREHCGKNCIILSANAPSKSIDRSVCACMHNISFGKMCVPFAPVYVHISISAAAAVNPTRLRRKPTQREVVNLQPKTSNHQGLKFSAAASSDHGFASIVYVFKCFQQIIW